MEIVLAPVRIETGDTRQIAHILAERVNELSAETDLVVFPQIRLGAFSFDPRGGRSGTASLSQTFSDSISQIASRYGVHIVAATLERAESSDRETILAAAPRGVVAIRTRHAGVSDSGETARFEPISVAAGDGKAALALRADLDDPRLALGLREARPDVLIVPMRLTGSPDEYRRIAVHNPPAALAGLRSRLAEMARTARRRVAAVNAIGQDLPDGECGPCGGVFVYDPQGRAEIEQSLYKESPYRLRIDPTTRFLHRPSVIE
ncbi:hypothetical protein JW916_12370 [Candidatus Sumerlaeota bacterium]|nr:hypothetical protein [Candidatus Sumerlaeota bacterium]